MIEYISEKKHNVFDWVISVTSSNSENALYKFHGTKNDVKCIIFDMVKDSLETCPFGVEDCPCNIDDIIEHNNSLYAHLEWSDEDDVDYPIGFDYYAEPLEELMALRYEKPIDFETRLFDTLDMPLYSLAADNLDAESGFTVSNPDDWFNHSNEYHFGCFHNTHLIGYCTINGADSYEDDDSNKAVCNHPLYTPISLLLANVYIKPEFRGKGVASQMVKQAIEYKRNKEGNKPVFIDVTEDIIPFFEKLGFEPIFDDDKNCRHMVLLPNEI